MNFKSGIERVANLDVEAARSAAGALGATVYVLPSDAINDYIAFFDWIRASVPLDPPIRRAGSWDALKGSLWSGLFSLESPHIVFIWPHVDAMLPVEQRETALGILGAVAEELADPDYTRGHPKLFTILLG